ncbi:hydrogenase maturation nickel metallochaperone HypA [Xylanimonas ulmi]|uniref:Hydrogenase maturation factor HypA n=1 Tax=Xylanimonas ulmi TaxID=228973 RepID=A0A4Q7M803_9MICO|nr:hydrogenase maturation nickel metallochaperone HypA [Xylanibacterium ulmi]RZS62818.1 hydrogenase-1 and 2 nickel incorporation protein HybF [Xylanibacterium ulmi]
MHELSLLRAVVDSVARVAAQRRARGVEAVGLRVGTLASATPEALRTAWPLAISGTAVAGARLDIDVVQAAVRCAECARDVPVDRFYALVCPVCATPTGELVTGRELAVAYADLADDAAAENPAENPGDAALPARDRPAASCPGHDHRR